MNDNIEIRTTAIGPPAASDEPAVVILTPEDLVRQLRTLRAQMPPPPAPVKKVGQTKLENVDPRFIQAAVNAVSVSDAVSVSVGRTQEDLQQEIDTVGRWTAAIDELRSLLREALTANAARRQRIGLAALQTYQISQQLTRDERNVKLEVHVAEMKRTNRFGKPRRAKADTSATPQPQAPQTTPAPQPTPSQPPSQPPKL